MGQEEIVKFLTKNAGKRYTALELSRELKVRKEAVSKSLLGLVGKEVCRELVFSNTKNNPANYVYYIDLRGRVYDVKEEYKDKQRLIHEIDEMIKEMKTAVQNLNNKIDAFKREVEGYK